MMHNEPWKHVEFDDLELGQKVSIQNRSNPKRGVVTGTIVFLDYSRLMVRTDVGGATSFSREDFQGSGDHKIYAEKPGNTTSHDPVYHPQHYTSHPSGVECIQIARHHNFNVGNALKYLWRSGLKDNSPAIQDLEKAVWYLNDEIDRLKGEV